MQVLRAEAMGLCFGVRDALAIAARQPDPSHTTIHGELVHNEAVLVQLRSRGFQMTAEADRRPLPATDDVLVTAHGISDRERQRLESAGKRLIDTTCPLVGRVHRAAQALQSDGYHVLVLGRPSHAEVRGIVEDLASYDVLETPEQVVNFGHAKLGLVCQTTTPPALAQEILAAVRARNPTARVRFADTICQPTRDRQQALDRLLDRVDAMIVVGGKNSNNTRQLVERSRAASVPVWHVQDAGELDLPALRKFQVIGLTAGTSTLDETIDAVYAALRRLPAGVPSTSRQWVRHFRNNAKAEAEVLWDNPRRLSTSERQAVLRSIQIFQLGESGGGTRLLRAAERYCRQHGDRLYLKALRLFILEERRHAAWLARFLEREGTDLLSRQWTNGVFRRFRNWLGLELMLAVLLAAELMARVYYAALRDATDDPVLRAICRRILCDEGWHVRFQCDRLGDIRSGRAATLRSLTAWAERLGFRAVCVAVWLNHAPVFRAAGLGFRTFWRKAGREFWSAQRLIRSASARKIADGAANSTSAVPARRDESTVAQIPAPSIL
ncbi:MAG TPA: 4-hydroxy-3-methylbut-2-enyl diphosphate reductase [Planctomycetaceae bacterium]|jgi:4-hydroxy-3-methylbut-2-enyl diphosphate reductase|nr:4-hydroxy-3-methylbut-2-enyl diphosphate reductase [Planctomycetaceae bacterium]